MIANFKRSVNNVKTELAGNGINFSDFSVDSLGDGYVKTVSRAEFEEVVFTDDFKEKMLAPLRRILVKF